MSKSTQSPFHERAPFPATSEPLFHMVIWPHGHSFRERIIDELESEAGCKIHLIRQVDRPNIGKTIDVVYAHDYAPLNHLKGKVKYLKFPSLKPKIITHIFFSLENPVFDLWGEGAFRHIHSKRLQAFKKKIREEYNPRVGGQASHHHVIHISDNPSQALHGAISLGFVRKDFQSNPFVQDHLGLKLPRHIPRPRELIVRSAAVSSLKARIRLGPAETTLRDILQTPHYLALANGDFETYENYMATSRGKMFQDGHSSTKFLALLREISHSGRIEPIIVGERLEDGSSVIIDGVHRASIARHLGLTHLQIATLGGQDV